MGESTLFDALHRMLATWDMSADSLGTEWAAFGERIQEVRRALPKHEAEFAQLRQVVARFTRNA